MKYTRIYSDLAASLILRMFTSKSLRSILHHLLRL